MKAEAAERLATAIERLASAIEGLALLREAEGVPKAPGQSESESRAQRPTSQRVGQSESAHSPKRPKAHIRAWAKANGYELGDRGRIPGAIIEAYERENG